MLRHYRACLQYMGYTFVSIMAHSDFQLQPEIQHVLYTSMHVEYEHVSALQSQPPELLIFVYDFRLRANDTLTLLQRRALYPQSVVVF